MGINGFDFTHKGYTAEFELDEDGYFFGRLINIPDLVTIIANDEVDAEEQTRIAVEDYIDQLEEIERIQKHKVWG